MTEVLHSYAAFSVVHNELSDVDESDICLSMLHPVGSSCGGVAVVSSQIEVPVFQYGSQEVYA